jgi:uncharacterized protein YkwD
MRTRAMLLAAAATLGGALIAATVALDTPATAITNCETSEAALTATESEFLRLLNEERARVGVGPLVASPTLNRAAAWKSADQASVGGLSHTDSLGRDPLRRIRDCGYTYGGWWGENVLGGTTSAQVAFSMWKGSPGHYANMIDGRFRVVGIGQHGIYWTTDFGAIDDNGLPAPTATTPPATHTATPPATMTPSPTPTVTSTVPAPVRRPFTIHAPGVSRE